MLFTRTDAEDDTSFEDDNVLGDIFLGVLVGASVFARAPERVASFLSDDCLGDDGPVFFFTSADSFLMGERALSTGRTFEEVVDGFTGDGDDDVLETDVVFFFDEEAGVLALRADGKRDDGMTILFMSGH